MSFLARKSVLGALAGVIGIATIIAFTVGRSRPLRSTRKVHASALTPAARVALSDAVTAEDDVAVDAKCKSDWRHAISVEWEPWGNTAAQAAMEVPGLADYDGFLGSLDGWNFDDSCSKLGAAHPVRAAQLKFIESCSDLKKGLADKGGDRRKVSTNLQVCYRRLAGYNLAVIDHLAQRLPLDRQAEPGIIGARYLAETERAEPNQRHLFLLMQDLVAADPRNPRLLRFAVESAFSASLASSGDEARQNAVLAKQLLDRLAAEAPGDSDLPALSLAERRLAKDFEGVRRLSSTVADKDPEAAAYYQAWAAYDEKNFTLTEKILSDFLETKPNHARYFEVALEQVRNHSSDELAFSDRFISIRRLGDRLGLDE